MTAGLIHKQLWIYQGQGADVRVFEEGISVDKISTLTKIEIWIKVIETENRFLLNYNGYYEFITCT